MNILLVEDSPSIVKGLVYSFGKSEYALSCALSLEEAEEKIMKEHFGLVILDVSLPDGNGFDFFEQQLKPRQIPAIFLTARDGEDDIVRGLNIGGEDYLTKPFSTRELMARIRKVLLRTGRHHLIKVADLTFDSDRMVLTRNEEKVELSPLELKIVSLLFTNRNRVVTRSVLLDRIWDWTGNYVDDHTVTVYLRRIREKIGSDVIKTIKGVGYRIDEE